MRPDPQDPDELDIPAEGGISAPQARPIRLLNSYSSNAPLTSLRRRQPNGDPPDPDPDPDDPPKHPPVPVSAPDLAVQFRPCLEDIPNPSGIDLKAAVVGALKEAFGADADVRYLCLGGNGTVGIWMRPSVSTTDSAARERGLHTVNILKAGENFAFFVNASFVRRTAMETWNNLPKRLNGDGNPDPNGPIHLTGFSVVFDDPNCIFTIIEGFDERPWPDVNFKLTITDRLTVSGGEIHCESDRNLDVDSSWLNALTGIFLLVFPPLGIVFLVERIIISTVDAPAGQSGVGAAAGTFIPDEILIPGGLKISAYYTRLNVSAGGIFTGGTALPAPRTPAVSIQGRTQLSVDEEKLAASSSYTVVTDDLLQPLQVSWSGDGTPLSPGALSTSFRFNTGGHTPGQVLTKRIAVRVTDRDNLSATASIVVQIHITSSDPDIPPVCRKKPWLCQPQ